MTDQLQPADPSWVGVNAVVDSVCMTTEDHDGDDFGPAVRVTLVTCRVGDLDSPDVPLVLVMHRDVADELAAALDHHKPGCTGYPVS